MTTPAPKRRWFQFSLRTLLVFVTLCAIACSWLAVKMQQAERQRKAVEAIRNLGGEVEYEWEHNAHGNPGPKRLRGILGNDFFWKTKSVCLNGRQVTDAGLEHLKGLNQLRELGLIDTQVTDAGLEQLEGLSRLETLDLSRTKITDVGLGHLVGLGRLQHLNLPWTEVTDEGVARLQQALPNCKIAGPHGLGRWGPPAKILPLDPP